MTDTTFDGLPASEEDSGNAMIQPETHSQDDDEDDSEEEESDSGEDDPPCIHRYLYPTLTPIVGRPTAWDIMTLQGEIYSNAHSICNWKAPLLGYLGVVMPSAEYLLEPGVQNVYIPPVHPGPYNTSATASERRYWKRRWADYTKYQQVRRELMAQMLKAVEGTWIYELQTLGRSIYTTTSPAELFGYLKTNYGNLSNREYNENYSRMTDPWDGNNECISTLWVRMQRISHLAAYVNRPISESNQIRATLHVLSRCTKYDRAVERWYDKHIHDQTWANLTQHFR